MKKIKNLLYSFTSFLLLISLMSLHSCTDKSGTSSQNTISSPAKPVPSANKGEIIEGHIALPATAENKMGLVMVHGEDNGIEHPLAYGIPYHINDVAATATPLMKGDDIQFSIKDDGKFYTALNIKKSITHTHLSNVILDFGRMINLDDHKNSAFPVVLGDTATILPSKDSTKMHYAGHIGEFLGIGGANGGNTNMLKAGHIEGNIKGQYSIYAINVVKNGNIETKYIGIPIASEKLIDVYSEKVNTDSPKGNQLVDDKRKAQTFYFTLSDIKLTWLQKDARAKQKINNTIEPILVREILPYHWHWYDKAVIPKLD